MEELDSPLLRKLYSDIIVTRTAVRYKGAAVYVKHFTAVDQGLIDQNYSLHFQEAKKQGLPTREEKIKQLQDSDIWTAKDEAWINSQKFYIENLTKTKSKMRWLSEINSMNEQINEAQTALNAKLQERSILIDLVAEIYANRRVNEIYILHSFFKDENLQIKLFTEEEFEELDAKELEQLVSIYNLGLDDFNTDNLKRISLSTFFQNIYCLCDNNTMNFFGKPVCHLTYYQTEIFSYGRFFYNILKSDTKPSSEIAKDPDKLIDWYSSSMNSEDILKKQQENIDGAGSTMIFGATKDDLKAAGLATLGETPIEAVRKAGRSLTAKDLVKA